MKKPKVQNLFLYRHRYGIGYTVLGLILVSVLFLLPLVSPSGLSQPEIDSAVTSYYDTPSNLIDLPYHLLQKLSISLFGLTTYAIKLPSILIGVLLGLSWSFGQRYCFGLVRGFRAKRNRAPVTASYLDSPCWRRYLRPICHILHFSL